MKTCLLKAFAAFFIVIAAAAPAHAEWREAKSEHFMVVGDLPERELRDWTGKLEQYDGMLRYLLDAKETAPVTVYVLGGLVDVQQAWAETATSPDSTMPTRKEPTRSWPSGSTSIGHGT